MAERRRLARAGVLLSMAVALVVAGLTYRYEGLQSRLRIIGLKAAGKLPSVHGKDLIPLLAPHSRFDLTALALTANPYATLSLPVDHADSVTGNQVFETHCSQCHGRHAEGGLGPALAGATMRHGETDWAVYRTIQDGIAGTGMRPVGLTFAEAWQVIAGLRHLQVQAGRLPGSESRPPSIPVTAEELRDAESNDAEWLNYAGGWSGRRNRDVPELSASSVGSLSLAWAYQLPADPVVSQSSPIAVRGLIIVTTAADVVALDQQSGDLVWRVHRELPPQLKLCCSRANRGVAVLGRLVYVATLDAHLIALDLDTGGLVWDTVVGDTREGYSLTGAPLIADDKVIVGVGGGEFGIRGFIDAYDPVSGKRIWRFHTIPAAGEPGSETWPERARAHGGGGAWVPGAYDPKLHLLYWGIGNPAPDHAPDARPGDNLFTCSVVALDISNGTLRWSYQFTPNDGHDWDSAQQPVIVDSTWNGVQRPLLIWANRNGFFYVLDRQTGEFLKATAFVRQTWNDGFDARGRPQVRPGSQPTTNGVVVYPSAGGATNWWPPTYSNASGAMFVAAREMGSVFFRHDAPVDETGQAAGGRAIPLPSEAARHVVLAIDLATGAKRWQANLPSSNQDWPRMGGLLGISNRLVIGGYGTSVFALDAGTGSTVWQKNLGAGIGGAPIVFRTGNEPRLALTAGSVLFVFQLGTRPLERARDTAARTGHRVPG